ncbi:putative nucleoside-diphosphate-sugar epimerase [Truncatella angustata]|uniref:Nucleoside-diphosphate-sugar epimerase n=1 Tax=Truncatella angustata TaxID=152316 RepID=A0A9P8ZVF3_9PEZI|nr:putative nucleoside-diphosphate-sugar epimerase [Truncatella angustata]KAH6648878.1 putative nucleoside-diphosphate-sugar epimerase [Truncatella angustata]KAH8194029.1 hypothetical protein TruAng_011810 [Truncatella angustata]
MTSPRIFITGGAGLIGGDYLHILTDKYPSWSIVALVRQSEKAALMARYYPQVEIILGTLDDVGILERESTKADVVLNFADCDHKPAAEAIIRGLAQRENIGTVIHTSGAKIIAWETESQPSMWGKDIPRRYNDWAGVEKLTTISPVESPKHSGSEDVLPSWAAHRDVDEVILQGFRNHPRNVRTAIVCPPTVYGPSRFPGFTRSIQLPRLLNVVLRRRRAFTINGNENRWNMVHTQDISQLYLLLTEAAVDRRLGDLWNEKGYYFAEHGEFRWGDVIREIARIGYEKGLLNSAYPEELSNEAVSQFWYGGQMNVSSTSLGHSRRAWNLLGWKPTKHHLLQDIGRTMDVEAFLLKSQK